MTGLCQRHDPAKAEERALQARTAAKVSHTPRALKPLTGSTWERDPDFSTAPARIAFREAVAGARGRGELDDKAAATLLDACDGAMKDDATPKGKAPATVIVETPQYGAANGHAAESA